MYFGSLFGQGVVDGCADALRCQRLVKAGPAGAGIEFCGGRKERVAAGGAVVLAVFVVSVVFSGKRALRTLLAQHPEFLGRQACSPVFFGEFEGEGGVGRVLRKGGGRC